MKNLKIILSMMFVGVMMCFSSTITAFASTTTQEGIKVSLVTDKGSYSNSDEISATLNVTNTNDYEIFNVVLEEYVPAGYTILNGVEPVKSAEKLKANETVSLSVVFSPDNSENSSNTTTLSTTTTQTEKRESTTTANSGTNSTTKPDSNSNKTNVTAESANTGDDTNVNLLFTVIVACMGIAIICIFAKKKSRKTLLSLLLCVSVAKGFINIPYVNAESLVPKAISISEEVTIDRAKVVINASVKYDMNSPETLSAADEYYQKTSEQIISTDYASASNTYSEAEVASLLVERGFNQNPVNYEYDLNGVYVDETEINLNSGTKHPMYQTLYEAKDGDIWSVYIVGKSIYACPLSYNFESDTEVEYIFGESDTLICYADDNNKFYTTIPKNTVVAYHVVDTINSTTLDKLTFEEVDKL